MSPESQRILDAYNRYKQTGQGSLEQTKEEIQHEDPRVEITNSELSAEATQTQSNGTKVELVERELNEYDNSLRTGGKVSEAQLHEDPKHRQLYKEWHTLKMQEEQHNENLGNLADRQNMLNIGYNNDFRPFEDEKIIQMQRRDEVANIEQQQYVAELRSGKVGLADALMNPRTDQSYFVNGKNVSKNNTSTNLKLFLTERGYDVTQPKTIPDSVLKPEKQHGARAQSSGELVANTYTNASKEKIAQRELVQQEHTNYQQETNAFRSVLHESEKIKQDITINPDFGNQNFPQPQNQQQTKSQKKYRYEYSPMGEFAKGLTNTVHSYLNLGENIGNFVTGQEQKPLSPTFTPIQDQFFGAVSKSIEQSQDYGIPFDATFQQNFNKFYDTQSKRDKYTIAGELSLEAMLWAIPISPAIKGAQYLAKTVPKFIGLTDNFTRIVLEGASAPAGKTLSKSEKILSTNPDKKFPSTYQNTNPMRKSIDKDIFALDTASNFSSQNVKLGKGISKPKSVFKSTKISLGKGIGEIKNNNKKGSGGGGTSFPRPPTQPPLDPPTYATSNGLQLLLENPTKQMNKKQVSLQKKKTTFQKQQFQLGYGVTKQIQIKQKPVQKLKQESLLKQKKKQQQQFAFDHIVIPKTKPQMQNQMTRPMQKQTPRTQLTPLIRPTQQQSFTHAFVPIQSQKITPVLAFPFPPRMDTIRKHKKKTKAKKEKLDNLEWNVPKSFLVGFGNENVRMEQSRYWGNIKGSKDQLARGYRRVKK